MKELSDLDQNLLLRILPSDTRARLAPHLVRTELPLGSVLYESGDAMDDAYFPANAIISLLCVMEDGRTTEISMVGNEGILGVSLFLGGESTPTRAIVQCEGYGYRLPGARLKAEFDRHEAFHNLLLRYTQALITQMVQTAACNRYHSIDQQLCRWLLLSMDRIHGDMLNMTQKLIADMLGVRREGITESAGRLQKAGVIEYRRGHIRVLNRHMLEELCCECYAVVKRESDRLLAPNASSKPNVPSQRSAQQSVRVR